MLKLDIFLDQYSIITKPRMSDLFHAMPINAINKSIFS
jgi:hypothetical protein